ncbi:PH domain-containing protein [Nakamurella antarctica]|uniref:PH domain-containing protein n=1 Tax=Nakamurella antarctica TaxID=1902245 RepID=A0A3G8ZMK5_9ACTN|nr:PH domain-containing protein [Nakamurella antarctica]AZI58480.1 PH domain-containing protein [Nakamurella antarctica]
MLPSDRAVFRLPRSAVVFPLMLFILVTPLATFRPYLVVLFAVPVAALIYTVVTRTVADGQELRVYTLLGRRVILWADLDGFEFRGPRWAIAVTLGGKRIRLPMVRPRDLAHLAAVSGGRLNLEPAADPEEVSGSEDVVAVDEQLRADEGNPADKSE